MEILILRIIIAEFLQSSDLCLAPMSSIPLVDFTFEVVAYRMPITVKSYSYRDSYYRGRYCRNCTGRSIHQQGKQKAALEVNRAKQFFLQLPWQGTEEYSMQLKLQGKFNNHL